MARRNQDQGSSKTFSYVRTIGWLLVAEYRCMVCAISQFDIVNDTSDSNGLTLEIAHDLEIETSDSILRKHGIENVNGIENTLVLCKNCNKRQQNLDFETWVRGDFNWILDRILSNPSVDPMKVKQNITPDFLIDNLRAKQAQYVQNKSKIYRAVRNTGAADEIYDTIDGKRRRSNVYSLYYARLMAYNEFVGKKVYSEEQMRRFLD